MYVKLDPGGIGHCDTCVGPSMWAVPFMKRPWKWSDVDWSGMEFKTCTTTVSPTLAEMRGSGHSPLMPIVFLSKAPSGFAVT